jgi:DNA-binding winged helix-turn-helix (wHTH) protein/TolB-like protein/cytochrome c-type biogenesis protein CcmH/NrfG
MGLTGKAINGLRDFADFRLDAEKRVLWAGETLVDLPPRAIDVLCVLTERPGEVVSKEDLFTAVWKGSFVEDSNLTHQIYELRKVFREHGLGDLIQTVPRRGYRFTGDIQEAFAGGEEIVVERTIVSKALIAEVLGPTPETATYALPPAPTFIRRNATAIIAVLILLLIGGTLALIQYRSNSQAVRLAEVRSIAVLPITSLGGQGDESLEMRLTDSLITKLAVIRHVTVRPTSSVAKLSSQTDPIEAGRMLEVDAVLTGRTQVENARVRLNLQMISVATGEQIWAAQLDGETTQMLAFQDAVAERMLASLNLPAEQAAAFEKQPTSNAEAFEEYTKGRYFWNKRTGDGLRLAIKSFENAVRLDPKFAEAYVGLADSYFLLFDYSYDTSADNVRLAKENLEKAIAIDPKNAEAYATLGLIQTTHDWNWAGAEASFKRAVELAPGSANPRHRYAMLLLKLGRIPEGEEYLLEARRLDPTSPSINMNLGVAYYFAKRYDAAAAQLRRSIEMDPSFASPHWYLARTLWMAGDRKAALGEYAVASRLVGFIASAELIEKNSDDDPARALGDMIPLWKDRIGPRGISPHDIAKLYAAIGDKEQTLIWLERGYQERHPWLTWMGVEPEFDFIRSEPRFTSLKERLNLN